jgi:AraC-like DNA-binding protein
MSMTLEKDDSKQLFVRLLEPLAKNNWFSPSILNNVRFFRSNASIPRMPVSYEPGIYVVAQGHKKGYLGDQVYAYDPYNYLVLSVPLPFECETIASPEEPMLGVSVSVNATMVSELLLAMNDEAGSAETPPRGISATPMKEELIDAFIRLLKCLGDPMHANVLGPQIVREIVFQVLCDEQGTALRELAFRSSHFSQIARALKKIHTEYERDLDISQLAREANMSISGFHSYFKAVTASSPLQYLKSIRLHKARMLMTTEGLNVSTAANRVGYESASQFSREFKRFFGKTPLNEALKMRSWLKEI